MTVFADYAQYYDLLYADKDYSREAAYVHGLLAKHRAPGDRVLELGCGTGAHAALLARAGLRVVGVDLSQGMLDRAAQRQAALPAAEAERLEFREGDLRTLRLERKFDVALALFHVMSYQRTNQDLADAVATVRSHLEPGGLFVFDCWYGPAVLTERPEVRVKRLEDERIQVVRIAEPRMLPNENVVEVCYEIFVRDRATGAIGSLDEVHPMRYLFHPEVLTLLERGGLDFVAAEEWLTGGPPGLHTWSVTYVARRPA
jgi:SAM-dependent methyltransferase